MTQNPLLFYIKKNWSNNNRNKLKSLTSVVLEIFNNQLTLEGVRESAVGQCLYILFSYLTDRFFFHILDKDI